MGAGSPPLPPGRVIELPGRGHCRVRELTGPPGAPTVVLLHGWTVTADLNWFPSYETLGRHFRVLALDQRGHGQGVRSRWPFRLEDCADDVAALAEVTRTRSLIPVGYSMGGPVAQLLWRRHPSLVGGLVMCATAARLKDADLVNLVNVAGLLSLSVASRLAPEAILRNLSGIVISRRLERVSMREWAAAELARSDPTALLEAGAALRLYDSSGWIGEVDVPVSVVVPRADEVVRPQRQRELAEAIPGAELFEIDGGHTACVDNASAFVPALVEAISSVTGRASPVSAGS